LTPGQLCICISIVVRVSASEYGIPGLVVVVYPSDGGVKELHGDQTVGSRPKVWTRGKKWK